DTARSSGHECNPIVPLGRHLGPPCCNKRDRFASVMILNGASLKPEDIRVKAAVIEKQGGLENLVYRDWPDPIPREGEVLLRVRSCGLNHLDIFVRRGMPGFPVPVPFISGGDIVGEIAALGPSVNGWCLGDRVALHPVTQEGMMGEEIPGGMAEYVR